MPVNSRETYVSPLMNRIKESEVLSLDTLAKYVPIVQAGFAAEEKLRESSKLSIQERRELIRSVARGETAKEKLVLISMPLIKSLAHKEYRRRQSWKSRVSLEDIVSEGLSGLMRGIKAYNVQGKQSSPTNYLGQWIVTDMRRNIESMEHDFSIPYEAMERQRKIRAVRSRLSAELGREPTDQEMLTATNDSSFTDASMMGRVKKEETSEASSRRRMITQKHLDEERDMFARTGAMHSSHVLIDGDEYSVTEAANAKSLTDEKETSFGNVSEVEDSFVQEGLKRLIEDSFSMMRISETQREIIRRRFSLSPYHDQPERTIREITQYTGVPKHKVNRVLAAYSAEMTKPNGQFHELVWRIGTDDVESIGMSWLLHSLGEFVPPALPTTNTDLINTLAPPRPSNVESTFTTGWTQGSGFNAPFNCPHCGLEFFRMYINEEEVPSTQPCPSCKKIVPYMPN
jgi:RNA polymerase sigma factor (sigma-70 family)